MTIDTSGEFWKGTEFSDVVTYLAELEPGGYPVHRVVEARCACGRHAFHVELNRDDELAATVCEGCGARTFVADSEQHWDEEEVERQTCPCGGETFEVGLGLSIKRDPDQGDWIRWGSLGSRCVACGTLASAVDWKSDLALTDEDALRVAPVTVLHEPR